MTQWRMWNGPGGAYRILCCIVVHSSAVGVSEESPIVHSIDGEIGSVQIRPCPCRWCLCCYTASEYVIVSWICKPRNKCTAFCWTCESVRTCLKVVFYSNSYSFHPSDAKQEVALRAIQKLFLCNFFNFRSTYFIYSPITIYLYFQYSRDLTN